LRGVFIPIKKFLNVFILIPFLLSELIYCVSASSRFGPTCIRSFMKK